MCPPVMKMAFLKHVRPSWLSFICPFHSLLAHNVCWEICVWESYLLWSTLESPSSGASHPLHCADQTPTSHLLQGSSLTLNCSRLHLGCYRAPHGQLCASCSLPDISLLSATEHSQSATFVFLVPPQSRSGLTQGRYDHVLNEEAQCGVFQSSTILALPL